MAERRYMPLDGRYRLLEGDEAWRTGFGWQPIGADEIGRKAEPHTYYRRPYPSDEKRP